MDSKSRGIGPFYAALFLPAMALALLAGCDRHILGTDVSVGTPESLRTALEDDRFTVQEGELRTINLFDLVDSGLITSCLANNANVPYKALALPPAPGQTEPNPFQDARRMSLEYHFRPDEAIVLVLETPPPCKYFSYQSFLAKVSSGGTRKRLFAPLGDTFNNMTIRTENTPDGRPGDPFQAAAVIVCTADRGIESRVRAAARTAGFSESLINTEVFPSALLNMGVEGDDDTFHFLHRMALFEDPGQGASYLTSSDISAFRITPMDPITTDPLPIPSLRPRGTGSSEFSLASALNALRDSILVRHSLWRARELATGLWFPQEGFDAIQRKVDILGATRDALYLKTDPFLLEDDPDAFVIVYGVNHEASGKASYSNFAFYGTRLLNGVAGVASPEFAGTAEEYLPGNPDAANFYVWKIARQGMDTTHTILIPWGRGSRGVEPADSAFVGFRLYLEKATRVGPASLEILYDRAIKFEPM